MREKFEQFIRDQSGLNADFEIGCNGQYKSDLMHFMFLTWQYQANGIDAVEQKLERVVQLISSKRQKCWSTSIESANTLYELEQEIEQALKDGAE
ncbi:hypothetical protein F993_01669 [Acinetobacter proteolyticus]|uniref:Uncharacterized protein n=1 Tax=Acinetobacter proteolyticus TaxID=1776741 RepID=A0ABN0JEC8_9GAMM|nr:hypothetical protein [Acinetobacter proteolyticus]ENU23516.1 hypothetical protein F993_01669 [Acinetobacter proteolyticus]